MIKQFILFLFLLTPCFSSSVLHTEGKGFLETEENRLILHVAGTPYEMGFQHGVLLKPLIQQVVEIFIDGPKNDFVQSRFDAFEKSLPLVIAYIPKPFLEEMDGLAEGSGIPVHKIRLLNLFPEMFHCSGIVALPEALRNKSLYHVRVLDYDAGTGLEKVAVLMTFSPESRTPFVSVSYPGFIGVVTGMNEKKISLGEIGGSGYGKWDGIPMSFLMRDVLERSGTLEEAVSIFSEARRTCEYYYLIADGGARRAVALYATPDTIRSIEPGNPYSLIVSEGLPSPDKIVISPFRMSRDDGLVQVCNGSDEVAALFFEQPKYGLILTGYPKPERFPFLFRSFREKEGHLDLEDLKEMVKPPVTCRTNLHTAIFDPVQLEITVSHAQEGRPASLQTYRTYSLKNLLERSPSDP